MSNHNRNSFIKASSLLVIDENGEKLGEIPTSEALKMAYDKGLDLIEVSPNVNPPVAKIMSWSKFKYEQDKKKKVTKNKSIDQKEMWFKAFIGENDLDHKLKKVKEFILKKHPVKLLIRGQGRVTPDHLKKLMESIIQKVSEYAEPESTSKFQGRNLGMIVRPRKTKLEKGIESGEEKVEVVEEK